MSDRVWIGLGQWMRMTPRQRTEFAQEVGEVCIDATDLSCAPFDRRLSAEAERDHDEEREAMGMTPRQYDDWHSGHHTRNRP